MTTPEQAQPATQASGSKVTLRKRKDCMHSVQFTTDLPDAIVKNIYVSRPQANAWTEVTVTVEGK